MQLRKIYNVTIMATMIFITQACEEAVESPLTDKKVILLSPANKVISPDTLQLFYWENLDNATQYQLQIVSPGFDSIVRLTVDTVIGRNQFQQELRRDNYQWRVKALNNSTESAYSDAWNLTIQ